MARIVLIAAATERPGVAEIGDIVSIHEDGVELGKAYDSFQVVDVPGVSVRTVAEALNAKIPARRTQWKNAVGEWHELKQEPKYALRSNLTPEQLATLTSPADDATRVAVLAGATKDAIAENPANTQIVVKAIGR